MAETKQPAPMTEPSDEHKERRFEGDSTYHFKLENSFDGGKTWLTFMDGTHRKMRS